MTDIFSGKSISLNELLDAKENRAKRQKDLLEKCDVLVCLTVNMPGNIKLNKASQLFFSEGLALFRGLEESFQAVFNFKEKDLATGPEYYLGLNEVDPSTIKGCTVGIENYYSWTRMLDIDVFSKDGKAVSRDDLNLEKRKCFVCENDAKICSSSRAHSDEEIRNKITQLYKDAFAFKCARLCGNALMTEAHCTPKPGLVDEKNNGSHSDMNLSLFEISAFTLMPFFEQFTKCGIEQNSFSELREIGKLAEKKMFETTGNVNTHMGAIFATALICYSCGKLDSFVVDDVCNEVINLSKNFANEKQEGARKSASDGYKIVREFSLPLYKELLKEFPKKQALSLTLLDLISVNNDTNILRRSNEQVLLQARAKSKEVLDAVRRTKNFDAVRDLDNWFIENNISPGGSADLLAITELFYCFE